MIPAVAGARHFLCVAKESNQRKATAGLANRGAGQKPKRTICQPGFVVAAPPAPCLSQSQSGINTHPGPSLTFARRLNMRASGRLVHCKCQVRETCVRQAGYPVVNLKQNKHACARILIRRVKVGDEAGRVFGRAWLRLNHGHRGAAWRIVIPQTVRFGS